MVDFAEIRRHCVAQAKELFDRFDKRKSVWAEVAREFYPLGVAGLTRGVEDLADESYVDERHKLFTMTPVDCMRKGASGFHGNLTSPARRWFRFRLPQFMTEDGQTTHQQRVGLDRLTEATEWVFSRGGVYSSLEKIYEHLLTFGFGAMVISADKEKVVRAQTLRVGTYALGVGPDGTVDRLVRRFSWTADQVIREFGDAGVPEALKEAAKKGVTSRRWTVYNIIEPNASGDRRAYDRIAQLIRLDDNMVYRSIYWLDAAKDDTPQAGILSYAGFYIEPIVAPRLDCELGDVYGRGRGLDGLHIARGLQTLVADILRASGNRHQPAVIASADLKDEGLRLGRGAVNYTRFGEQSRAAVLPIFSNPPDTRETREDAERFRQELNDLFFNSAFAAIDAVKQQPGVKTATEIDAIVRENMERLGSVVTNLDKELLDPLVSIVARYTLQANIAPLTPEEISQFGSVNVEYVSQIHLAQKQSSISSVRGFVDFVGMLGSAKPEALDKLDVDGTLDKFADMTGVPETCVASDEDVETVRAARAEAQQKAQEMEEMQAQTQSLRNLGGVPMDDENAGGALVRGLGGGVE